MYKIKSFEEVIEFLQTKSFRDLQKEIMYWAFSVEECKKLIEYFLSIDCVIIGLTILEINKNTKELDLAYAWWNFKYTVLENSSSESSSEALNYLNSDFVVNSESELYVDIYPELLTLYLEQNKIK